MKINAKKINSASENAIQSSYLFSRYANWFTYKEYHETSIYLTHLAWLNTDSDKWTE